MSLSDYLFGRRLATFEEGEQRVGASRAFPCSGSTPWLRRLTVPKRP